MDFNKNLPWILLLAFLVSFVLLVFQSPGTAGGADDINHYWHARYAFDHPEFFFDTKAKTVFVLLRAPIAQLGYNALRIFNVLLGLAAALLTFLTARKLNYRHSILAVFLVVFAPAYTVMMLSGMNEVMFSLFLVLGMYLFFLNRYVWSAIVISLLPFIRTEGFVVFPAFIFAFALLRQWKAIPFLFSGFLVVSFAGSFLYHDFFWVITKNPYSGSARDIYGSGPLLHYVYRYRSIFGLPFFLLILLGLLYVPVRFLRTGGKDRATFINEVLIGFLPFLSYLAAHSYVYWKGMGNSVGLTRVIAAVFPSAALLAIFGLNGLTDHWHLSDLVKRVIVAILAAWLLVTPFRVFRIPVELSPSQRLIKEAASWLEDMEYTGRKIYYWDPYWWFFLGINPSDESRIHMGLYDRSNTGRNILPGEIVLWDAHFGPNEGRTPLTRLKDNPDFCEIKTFKPGQPFKVLGGYDYEIHIFERLENRNELDEEKLISGIRRKEDSLYQVRILGYDDFENIEGRDDSSNYSSTGSRSGTYSYRLCEGRAFLPGIRYPLSSINPDEGARISVSVSCRFEKIEGKEPLFIVLSLKHKGKIYYYRTREIKAGELHTWTDTSVEFEFPPGKSESDILDIYLWDMGAHTVYVDDFMIALEEPKK